jgi:hypothetical protein
VKARYPVWLNQRLEKQLKAINDRQCAVKFSQVYWKRGYMYYNLLLVALMEEGLLHRIV